MVIETKSPRYKLLVSEKKNQIIDLDSNFLLWIFPAFRWFLAVKTIAISDESAMKKIAKETKPKNNFGVVIILGVVVVLSKILNILMNEFVIEGMPFIQGIVIVVFLTMSMLGYKCYRSRENRKMLERISGTRLEGKYVMKISNISVKYFIQVFFMQLILYTLVLLFAYISIDMPGIVAYLLLLLSLFLYTFFNTKIKFPDNAKIE
ncbi:DUF443 family protein [Listeria grandensis]|uniref:DUF443 family protein n=1 Tax=Listeria grandensis TaxID=1494963 RepID=A0A7X0Y419_9LIST|nr:DUF443 family protein [Listeria grandensis]MBC1936478.1 DUF443 family protein [Listeria grandensis]